MKNQYFWTFLELQKGTHFGVPFWSHFGLILGPILEPISDLSEDISRCILEFIFIYFEHAKKVRNGERKKKRKDKNKKEKERTNEVKKNRKI